MIDERKQAVQEILQETFGMWQDRTDIPSDGAAYMHEIRRGHRFEDLWHCPENDMIGQVLNDAVEP